MLTEIFRMSPNLILIIPLFIAGITANFEWIFFSFGGYLCELLNWQFKLLVLKFLKEKEWIYRPTGAIQCSNTIICGATEASTNLGMPSGHSQIVGFLAGYFILKTLLSKKNKKYKITIIIASLVIMGLGMIGRLNSNMSFISADKFGCHTLAQTIAGASIGLLFGMLWHFIYSFKKIII